MEHFITGEIMSWRNCHLYTLEKCGPEKPCRFNGSLNFTCEGRHPYVEVVPEWAKKLIKRIEKLEKRIK